jgi:hypothetical protein
MPARIERGPDELSLIELSPIEPRLIELGRPSTVAATISWL